MRRILPHIFGLATLIIVALGLGLAPAQAPTICTVISLDDSGADTLRAHIADATCDIIEFDPDILPGTIMLESQLIISRNPAIEGPGADQLTISGNDAVRVFQVEAGNTVAIAGVTIREGRATQGGGIENAGTLTVANSTLSGNFALRGGGIFNTGTLTVEDSTLAGNVTNSQGGGILNTGTLTVEDSTLAGNRSPDGGGILNFGALTVENSTFSGNSGSRGGGILNTGTLTVTNSTFSGNSVFLNGGGISSEGDLTVAHSTFSGNSAAAGGGIINFATLTVKNSLVANSPSGGNCRNLDTFTAQGVNLADDATCSGFTQVNDVRLGDLALNGGLTETHALVPDSLALDAVTDCTLVDGTPVLTDQREVERPQGPRCDVGAFELTVDLEADLLAFFDQAVAAGTLEGSGSGASAEGRLNALRHMLATALDLIAQGELEEACGQLSQAYLRTDGAPQPPDFVKGAAAPTLAAMIFDLMDDLGCP